MKVIKSATLNQAPFNVVDPTPRHEKRNIQNQKQQPANMIHNHPIRDSEKVL